ncbi:MAG: glycoside hydrolase family 18 [Bacteroides sp.]|nr:glycoside hydrolase family 18 [Bacteroides sp.]MCM1413298.1 glycoside hydrolase family 18 [Bacteroides sp.]MCM1471392.1 glycoside hydrolase family 18 [Bacteroides sp.]
MNNKIKYFASALMVAALGASFTACDDWTEPEHIDINYSNVEGAENYPAYLEALRAYRKTDHTQVYAWVNLSADGPVNQSERVTSLPDSIDVLVVSTPTEIHPTVLADLNKVRNDKGMKVMYQIDFDAVKAEYTGLCEGLAAQRDAINAKLAALDPTAEDYETAKADLEAQLEAAQDPDLYDYMLNNLTESLNYAADQKLDGVMFAFDGKSSNHMTAAEKAQYNAQQLLFLGAASDWHKRNPEMSYDFLGLPQNISKLELLNEFNMIFIRQGLEATNADLYSYYLTMGSTEGVPTDRLGMMTTYISADPDDATTGVFTDGTYALDGFAKWVAGKGLACIGIQNVQNDYFNPTYAYPHVRAIIQAANPKIK